MRTAARSSTAIALMVISFAHSDSHQTLRGLGWSNKSTEVSIIAGQRPSRCQMDKLLHFDYLRRREAPPPPPPLPVSRQREKAYRPGTRQLPTLASRAQCRG